MLGATRRSRRLRTLLATGIAIILLIVCSVTLRQHTTRRSLEQTGEPAYRPLPQQQHDQSTSSAAEYVGVDACAECHVEQARTFRQTAHSLALSEIDASREPPDTGFYHESSGRTYSVYRQGSELRHREAVLDEDGTEIAAADYPLRYLIGSGRHTRSYLVEIDGFLCESPLTWYASRQSWGLSPGYDHPDSWGFERPANSTCLYCHVGLLADGDRAYQRAEVVELAIGCERCHGPGSLHVAQQRAVRHGSAKPDVERLSIVNPAKLSRELGEAVCAQCHLTSDASAVVAGRTLSDYRPGLPLADFCVHYRPDEPGSSMTVVGHVEQMRLSRCYQSSETLTCTTCHDPHSDLEPSRKREQSLKACRNCHAENECGLTLEERHERPAADCLTCHMPQVPTEIQHIAFTHHRIGVHVEAPVQDADRPSRKQIAELVPIVEPEGLSELDSLRNLGLAYFSLAQNQTDPEAMATCRGRAFRLLQVVRSRGGGHREVAAALARIYRDYDLELAAPLAHEALASEDLSAKSRINCLYLLGEWGSRFGRLDEAKQALEQVTNLRLLSDDWLLLGDCRQRSGDFTGARTALERAVSLAPLRPQVHTALASVYQQLGEEEAARSHLATAQRLLARTPSGPGPAAKPTD